jgi:spermidine synthase
MISSPTQFGVRRQFEKQFNTSRIVAFHSVVSQLFSLVRFRSTMATLPVLLLLLYDLIIFLGGAHRFKQSPRRWELLLLSGLFFCSGMPALIYQIVWQRVLFSIYGVNAESVAVVVSAFMLGLGVGSLVGGWASTRCPQREVLLFGTLELGVALFGLASLHLFHWAARFTAGASLPATVIFSLLLMIFPTVLMGATLPLLVQHFVRRSGHVGFSVAILYFVNTLGSAFACYLCATFLLRELGQSGSVYVAAGVNVLVGMTAFLFGRHELVQITQQFMASSAPALSEPKLPLWIAMLVAAITGFIALGFEITWFRVFALASQDRAPAFALLLSTFLAGIAAGSYISEKLTAQKKSEEVVQVIGASILIAGAISVYLPPLVALLQWKGIPFLLSAPVFFVTAALLGSVLPLLCQLAVSAGHKAGKGVSWTYVSNILGSTLGSLVVGFIIMHHFGLKQVSLQLGLAAVITGTLVLFLSGGKLHLPPHWVLAMALAGFVSIPVASQCYSRFFQRLIFGVQGAELPSLSHVVENRNGVIAVTRDGAVFGNGVYDGYFNVDPALGVNFVVRAYALSLFHAAPKHILMIGLSSGSWAQILVNHPQAESLDVVEINPGYLQLIPQYPVVASLLRNPRVHIYLDDGRRWLLAHPEGHYDVIVMNTSFYWRDHLSDLLSVDFLKIIRRHLNPGGVFYYNTTGSEDVMATGLRVFPYGLRVVNFLAVSDSPVNFSETRWMSILRRYRIDSQLVFDPSRPKSEETLATYVTLARSLDKSKTFQSLESSESLNRRLGNRLIITDDNMGWEWREALP